MKLIQRLLGRSDIYFGGSVYMRRWRFFNTPWFGLRVHHILRSDADRELHDHPFTFVSLILRGGYFEHTVDGRRTWYGPGSIVVRSGEALHRLELRRLPHNGVFPGAEIPAWTLVFRGSMRRHWGFLADSGWTPWKRFIEERYKVEKRDRPFAAESSL